MYSTLTLIHEVWQLLHGLHGPFSLTSIAEKDMHFQYYCRLLQKPGIQILLLLRGSSSLLSYKIFIYSKSISLQEGGLYDQLYRSLCHSMDRCQRMVLAKKTNRCCLLASLPTSLLHVVSLNVWSPLEGL